MPQMSPMNWLLIMISTSLSIMILYLINYSQFAYKNVTINNSKMTKHSWKW